MPNSQADYQNLEKDPKISSKFEILSKLGEGCFGSLYKAINRTTNKSVALKIEYHNDMEIITPQKRSNLVNEIMILEKLKDIEGVPKIFSGGKWDYGYFMEIELLTSCLYEERNREFTQIEISSMACELIGILSSIHSRGVIHQDLKPQNIMRNNLGNLVIIDFGLSNLKKESDNIGDLKRKKRGFIGTPRYASIAAHNGQIQTPKDDIESLLYVLGSLYVKKAPWSQLKGSEAKRLERIERNKIINSQNWFKECGDSFYSSYEYIQSLKGSEAVDYIHLMNTFNFSRKRYAVKSEKLSNLNTRDFSSNNLRRKSEADGQKLMKIPTINIHFVDSLKINEKNDIDAKYRVRSFDEEDKENALECKAKTTTFKSSESDFASSNNFSQMAQDGYMELMQILSKKIFSFEDIEKEENIDQGKENAGKEAEETSSHSEGLSCSKNKREPNIQKLSKYEVLHFKNPFEIY